jgi:transcriptional regulator with XRE-family HTH domain
VSQEVLAGLVGKTAEWLHKVENNRAELDRLLVIRTIASELDVSLGDLIGEPSLFEWSEDSGRQTIPALRAALRDYRHLTPAVMAFTDDKAPPLTDLERDVADLWNVYQRSQYGTLARRLPYLIHDCRTATWVYDGGDAQRAHALTAYIHQVATLFLTKLGEADLAWIAASRGLAAANTNNGHVVIGSLGRAAAHALVSIGGYAQARGLASTTAQYVEPRMSRPSPQLLSVYGSLHLVCALAAARDNDRTSADTHLAEAEASAQRLGVAANHVWSTFGPMNVKIHQVCVAMERGDVQRAIDIAPSLDTSALPVELRVRHAIETARAYTRWNRIDEALDALLTAERVGSDQVRYHRLSRMIVRRIASRPRPPRLAIELSERMGVGAPPLKGSQGRSPDLQPPVLRLHEATRVTGVHKPGVRSTHVRRYFLGYRKAAFRVHLDALRIADKHVDHPLHIANTGKIIVQRQRPRGAQYLHLGPRLLAGGERASLLVGPRHKNDRTGHDPVFGQQFSRQHEVFRRVGCFGFD